MSNLVGIDEVRAGLTADDSRGVWALGGAGASVTWAHGLLGDDWGPNCRNPRGDDIVGCNQLHETFGEAFLIREGMPCCSYAGGEQATARSMHPGGVNVLMMDGAVRFVSDEVDQSVWHAMHSRQTRDVQIPEEPEPAGSSAAPIELSSDEGVESITRMTNSIGMELARISAGEFIMGLPDEGENLDTVPREVPAHQVRITKDFYLGITEVTQGQYEQVMGTNPSWHSPSGGGRAEIIDEDFRQYPVEQVSWADAVVFCRRLSALPTEKASGRRYRLPTEAEWEYACRAGSTLPFDLKGEGRDEKSSFNMRLGRSSIKRVGLFQPNKFGLYDMRGNVIEWCLDWFAWDYYSRSPEDDPQGPASGVLRVVRGTDWRFTYNSCRNTRFDAEPWRINPFLGFRVVCNVASQ